MERVIGYQRDSVAGNYINDTKMKTAYSACGNTFWLVTNESLREEEKSDFVIQQVEELDGIIFVEQNTDLYAMDYFNRDGSRGEMCGNGARAFLKALYDLGAVRIGQQVRFRTRAGILQGLLIAEECVRVMMPRPEYLGSFCYQQWNGFFFRVGVPHLVFIMKTLQSVDVETLGYRFSHLPEFPVSTNVNFVEFCRKKNTSDLENSIAVRTYERGVWRETCSCGTGSVASACVRKQASKHTLDEVSVYTKGGTLAVIWSQGEVYLQGNVELLT